MEKKEMRVALVMLLCLVGVIGVKGQYSIVNGLMMSKNGKVTYVNPQQDSANVTLTLPNKSGVIALVDEAGGAAGSVPIATIVLFAGRTIPAGFKECNGDTLSRTVFANLFAVIDTMYGNGNGSTTFNIPKIDAIEFNTPSDIPASNKQDLLAWYPFTGNSLDHSGNGNNLALLGNTVLTGDRFGVLSSAYRLDGYDDALVTAAAYFNSSLDHTISMWFKSTDSTKVSQVLFNTDPHAIEVFAYRSYCFAGESFLFALGNGLIWLTGAPGVCNDPGTTWLYDVDDKKWNHLALTKAGLVWRVYLNGQESRNYTALVNTANVLAGITFGAGREAPGAPFEEFVGDLDDISVWQRALTAAEIHTLYEGVPVVSSRYIIRAE
ncbi:MAG: tail fiber protein [Ignavibacteria bacterium]|nr:tail fiber protein [Ignavibacteria bacterium]